MKNAVVLSLLALTLAPAAFAAPRKSPPKKKSNVVHVGSGRCAYQCDSTYDNRVYIFRTSYCPSWPFREELNNGITIYCSQRAN